MSVLSYLANATENPFIATFGPLVAFIAITSSFLGHFLGARESLNGLLTKHTSMPIQRADKMTIVSLFISIWIAAVINPSILGMMETLSGPVIAMILFIMPVYAIYRVDSLKIYRGKATTVFVLLTGLLAVSALLFAIV